MRRYRITRSDALQAIDHNALARLQTGHDHPAALLVRAQANFAVRRLVAVVDHEHDAQLGRASCRGRVRQDESISVVAESFKKKCTPNTHDPRRILDNRKHTHVTNNTTTSNKYFSMP